jgi:hypothetical protein
VFSIFSNPHLMIYAHSKGIIAIVTTPSAPATPDISSAQHPINMFRHVKDFGQSGWVLVSGNQYVTSIELFDIYITFAPANSHSPIRLGLLEDLGFHPIFAKKHEPEIKYEYLARQQNTCVAVLPIHTKAERSLFAFLVSETHGLFSGPREPNWPWLRES